MEGGVIIQNIGKYTQKLGVLMSTFFCHYMDLGLDMQDVHVEFTGLPVNTFVIVDGKRPFWLEGERISLYSWVKGQILNMNYLLGHRKVKDEGVCFPSSLFFPMSCSIIINDKIYRKVMESEKHCD